MKRLAVCILLLTFCANFSKAAPPDGDKPTSNAAAKSATETADSNKLTVPEKSNE